MSVRWLMMFYKVNGIKLWQFICPCSDGSWWGYYASGKVCDAHRILAESSNCGHAHQGTSAKPFCTPLTKHVRKITPQAPLRGSVVLDSLIVQYSTVRPTYVQAMTLALFFLLVGRFATRATDLITLFASSPCMHELITSLNENTQALQ